MKEPQELRSIDELFRNTFGNLPETPSENGWDNPDDKVWNHIHAQIRPPLGNTWSLKSILLLAGFSVAVLVGIYFAFRQDQTAQPVSTPDNSIVNTPAPTQHTETPVETVAPSKEEQPVVSKIKTEFAKSVKVQAPAAITAAPVEQPEESVSPRRSSGAAPLPGTKVAVSPNTTEARKAEHQLELERIWNTPLEPLPVPRQK